ncbi:MAG: hypothetical protein CSB55_02585 [Candidatus Cloacimonadota bacterium]|nr:MAG: hypothetical protein CSB55_02585 [Candidatus Cloacimonadota bacterium]
MHSVDVEIFGKMYRLKTDNPERILKCAEFLNNELNAIYKKFPTVDTGRIVALGAMIITEKMFLLQEENAKLKSASDKVNSAIDNVFNLETE